MRLLHIAAGNMFGGVESMLLAAASVPPAEAGGDQQFAVCFDGRLSHELEAKGASVHRLGAARFSRPWSVHRARTALRRTLADGGFDAVACHGHWTQAIFGGVCEDARLRRAYFAHDATDGRHWLERLAARTRPDLVFANSAFTATAVKKVFPAIAAEVVHPPVELDGHTLAAYERASLREELGAPARSVVLLQASRFERWKGHALLLEALSRVDPRARWELWFAGGAQREPEAQYLAELKEAVRRSRFPERVRFLGHRRDVPELLRAADLHVQVNTGPEPFGLVYVEALAAGLPTVGSDLGGPREIIDRTCGRLVAPDADAVAGALEELIGDEALRRRLGAAGPARARALCDPPARVRRWMELLAASASEVRR